MFKIMFILFIGVSNVELRTVNSKFQYNKLMTKSQERLSSGKQVLKCSELPAPVLNDILGAAFNSRYKFCP
jgi:hypothetical protein